jgi:hypothetical protein
VRSAAFWLCCGLVLASCSYVGRGGASPVPSSSAATPAAQVTSADTTSTPTATPTASATATSDGAGFVPADEAMALLFRCGILGRVAAYFRVPEGNDIWDHFPKMGRAPEMEGQTAMFVAVYDGEVSGPFTGHPDGSPGPVTDALCVVDGDAAPIIYVNVSREGMRLPSGAYIAAPDEWLLPTPPSS